MNKKITLSINEIILTKAENHAKSKGKSLPQMLEEYLILLHEKAIEKEKFKPSPRVAALGGCIKGFPESADYKEILAEELVKRYEGRL